MKNHRVVVTGMGLVSCLGNDIEEFTQNLLAGKSGSKTITHFDCSEYPTHFACYIPEFDTEHYIDKKQARRIDPFIRYTFVAGKKALEMAQANPEQLDPTRCGILIGSGMGGMQVFVDGVDTLKEKGLRRLTPFFIPYILTNMASGLLGMELGFLGPNYSVSTACATATYGIVNAANHIRRGDADLMLCGGAEAAILPMGIAGFCACKALSTRNDAPEKASRPWDKDRDGFVMGEGAGVLVLESLEHAQKRGAPILAEYLGGGLSCDAYHMTDPRPDGEGIALAIRSTLDDAHITPNDVGYINTHGTSTPAGDMTEIRAYKKVFPNPENIAINSTKSMIGHLLGAAGGVEAIATIQALRTGTIHPTINLDNPEPDLAPFHAPTSPYTWNPTVGISCSFGFGGHNGVVAFAPWRE